MLPIRALMSGLGVLETLLHSRRSGPAGGRSNGDWRDNDGLVAAVAAALLADGKDTALVRQILARALGRGLFGGIFGELSRRDPGAAALAALLAEQLQPGAGRSCVAAGGGTVDLTLDEKAVLADWLRLAATVSCRLMEDAGDVPLRAQLALAWGQAARLAAEGEVWLADEDPRVRANAVESLWGRRDEQAAAVFLEKLEDRHQRVAANAAVGLYLAGRTESVAALWSMAHHADPARRSAAVWAMGRTGDWRFLDLLSSLRKGKAAPVVLHRNVVRARERILRAEAIPRGAASLRISRLPAGGCLRLRVQVSREGEGAGIPLRPTDFTLECDGAVVWRYAAWRSSLAAQGAAAVAAPGSTAEEALDRAAALVAEAGGPVPALVRLELGYAAGNQQSSRTGAILEPGGPAAGSDGFAEDPVSWRESLLKAARVLAADRAESRIVILAERQHPEWLTEPLPDVARQCAPLHVSLCVLFEPGAMEESGKERLRQAGIDVAVAPEKHFPDVLRAWLAQEEETWLIEAPEVEPAGARQVRVVLRSACFRGEAVCGLQGR